MAELLVDIVSSVLKIPQFLMSYKQRPNFPSQGSPILILESLNIVIEGQELSVNITSEDRETPVLLANNRSNMNTDPSLSATSQ